ncbi:Lcl domain-containing protein [Massilia sp. SYSU DXS3249]
MILKRTLSLAVAGALFLLASCGGHDGVELGPFPAINVTEGDAPVTLMAPSSKSPGTFSYTSSNERVGRIAGDLIIIGEPGTSTITAQQGRVGSYYPTSTSTTLTVAVRVCEPPAVKEQGVCVVPVSTAGTITSGGLAWMPASAATLTWSAAYSFCKTSKIGGTTGWRLPTQPELNTLHASGQLAGKAWTLGDTWTSTIGVPEKSFVAVNLSSNVSTQVEYDKKIFVSCVR